MSERNRYVLKGANHLVAETYAEQQGWSAVEWIYLGPGPERLVVIDLDDKEQNV
jgi:hypothetical protein